MDKKLKLELQKLAGLNKYVTDQCEYLAFDDSAIEGLHKQRDLVERLLNKSGFSDILKLAINAGIFDVEFTEDERKSFDPKDKGHFSHVAFDVGSVFVEDGFFKMQAKTNYTSLCGQPKWASEVVKSGQELKSYSKKRKAKKQTKQGRK